MTRYTIEEWAEHEGLTVEEIIESDMEAIVVDGDRVYKELKCSGELVELY